jgi:hypothetical protein
MRKVQQINKKELEHCTSKSWITSSQTKTLNPKKTKKKNKSMQGKKYTKEFVKSHTHLFQGDLFHAL